MSNIRVSYAEIEQTATALAQGREEIAAKLQLLQQQIETLGGSGFVTEQASVRFTETYTGFTGAVVGLVDQLGDMQTFLMQTAAAIREMDAQLAARVG